VQSSELLMEGVWLMLFGMGIVFTFLIVLVFVLQGMSRLAAALERRHGGETVAAAAQTVPRAHDPGADEELIAVISAAVARYRSTK